MVVVLLYLSAGIFLFIREQTLQNLQIVIFRLMALCNLVGETFQKTTIKNFHTRENIKSYILYAYIVLYLDLIFWRYEILLNVSSAKIYDNFYIDFILHKNGYAN
jgi:hypothetical protein